MNKLKPEEQDRINAAIVKFIKADMGALFFNELEAAAKPLLEKEPRVGYVPEMEDGEVLVHEDGSPANSYKAIELMDTPYIVQKGRKPVKLEDNMMVVRMPKAPSISVQTIINSLRVDCDE